MAVPTYVVPAFAIDLDMAQQVRIREHPSTKDGIVAGLKAEANGNGAIA
jgi:hypothetical protein